MSYSQCYGQYLHSGIARWTLTSVLPLLTGQTDHAWCALEYTQHSYIILCINCRIEQKPNLFSFRSYDTF